MAYTPPDGDAVEFTWAGASSYTPPDGDATDFQWPSDAVIAQVAAAGLLGAPAAEGSQVALARVAVSGLLGQPSGLGETLVPRFTGPCVRVLSYTPRITAITRTARVSVLRAEVSIRCLSPAP